MHARSGPLLRSHSNRRPHPMLASLAFVVAAYLIGSVSFAVVTSKAFGLPDPHSYGSGNPGATNVLRTGNKAAAALTLAGDGAKGWLAVFLAQALGPFVRRRRLDGAGRCARRVRRPPLPDLPSLRRRQGRGHCGGHRLRALLAARACARRPVDDHGARVQDQLARGAHDRDACPGRRVLRVRQFADGVGDGRHLAAAVLAAQANIRQLIAGSERTIGR